MRGVNPFLKLARRATRRVPGLAALGLAAVWGAGADAEREVLELDPYAVEERGWGPISGMTEAGMEKLTPAETGRTGAATLGELLSWRGGVASSFHGAAVSRPVVRGFEGRRVAVREGGLATGDFSDSSPDHAVAIEPQFVREVTIHKGAAVLLHGGGAIGGAVDIDPDYLPRAGLPERGEAEAGWLHDTANSGDTFFLKAGTGGAGWALRLNALDRRTGDYRIPGLARTENYDINNRLRLPPSVRGQVAPNPRGRVPNTFSDTAVIALGAGWFPGRHALAGGYQHYASRYGVPVDGHTHGNPYGIPGGTGPSPNDGIAIDLEQNRLMLEAEAVVKNPLLKGLRLRAAGVDFVQREYDGAFLSNDFAREALEARVEMLAGEGPWLALAGAEASRADYRNRNISYAAGRADEDRLRTLSRSFALFALQEYRRDRWTARLGMRGDWEQAERRDRDDSSSRLDALSASGELSLRLHSSLRLLVAAHSASRLPGAEERFIEAPHGATGIFQLPDPGLGIERSRGAEARLQYARGAVAADLSLYRRRFDGYVFQENQGYEIDGLTAYAFVQRDAAFRGGELDLRWRIFADNGDSLQLGVFADWIHARDLGRAQPLPRIPPARAGARLTATSGPWSGGLHALHAFAQERVPREVFGTLAYQSPTPSYTLVSLEIAHRRVAAGVEAELRLRISNLLDREARQHSSFLKDVAPLPGRGALLTLTFRL
jgi:iron complex outermembrane recepter protein